MEKQVAAPPMMTNSWSSESTTLEPIINGRGVSAGAMRSLFNGSIFPVVETAMISSSRLMYPELPTPPRRMKEFGSWTQAPPNLVRRATVWSLIPSAASKIMVGLYKNRLASTLCIGQATICFGEVKEIIRLGQSVGSDGKPPKVVQGGYTSSPCPVV